MKHLLLTLLFAPLVSFSQLPDGSIAPDWNLTDLNGNSHHLYSYLDSDYTVIINVCATWCPPCYSYHLGGTLDSLWDNYGPDGSNEMRVFHIEADSTTTIADLYGTGSNTQGDFVTGSLYPIINDDNFLVPYQITYYPTVYMICPDRIITEVGQVSFTDVYAAKFAECDLNSIIENELAQLTVYPNPSQGLVTISTLDDVPGVLTVLNATGAKVLTKQLTAKETLLDLSGQPSGLYLIQINSDKGQTVTKLNLY